MRTLWPVAVYHGSGQLLTVLSLGGWVGGRGRQGRHGRHEGVLAGACDGDGGRGPSQWPRARTAVLTAWRLLLATMYSDGGGELRAHRQGAGAALLGGRGRRVLRTDLPPAGA